MKISQETKALNEAIASLLQTKSMRIESYATGRGENNCYKYTVRIIGHKTGDYAFEYSKGAAHRYPDMKGFGGHIMREGKPIFPMPAEVINCLLLDASCVDGNTFEDFCGDLGYDTDSRKALESYLACQEEANALRRLFTSDMIGQFESLLEDY